MMFTRLFEGQRVSVGHINELTRAFAEGSIWGMKFFNGGFGTCGSWIAEVF